MICLRSGDPMLLPRREPVFVVAVAAVGHRPDQCSLASSLLQGSDCTHSDWGLTGCLTAAVLGRLLVLGCHPMRKRNVRRRHSGTGRTYHIEILHLASHLTNVMRAILSSISSVATLSSREGKGVLDSSCCGVCGLSRLWSRRCGSLRSLHRVELGRVNLLMRWVPVHIDF